MVSENQDSLPWLDMSLYWSTEVFLFKMIARVTRLGRDGNPYAI